MKKYLVLVLLTLLSFYSYSQTQKNVLFLGNSYTNYNGTLPVMVDSIAKSMGDTLIHDINAPGGYTMEGHYTNTTTIVKIQSGNWDHVVIQDQSQRPSFMPTEIDDICHPYADSLNEMILQYNPQATTMFFMTWGKENGDSYNCPYYPILCTYFGNQQRLTETYFEMSQMFHTEVAEVGVAWKVVRDSISSFNLYAGDGSHPSIYGTYLAACIFYAKIFGNSPIGAYYPSTISYTDATKIQYYCDQVVFHGLSTWNDNFNAVQSQFGYNNLGSMYIEYISTSLESNSSYWDFGDGSHAVLYDTAYHQYQSPGIYNVMHIAYRGLESDTSYQQINVQASSTNSRNEDVFQLFPNPSNKVLHIQYNSIKTLTIYSLSGNIVYNKSFDRNQRVVDVYIEDFSPGKYIVEINKGIKRIFIKL